MKKILYTIIIVLFTTTLYGCSSGVFDDKTHGEDAIPFLNIESDEMNDKIFSNEGGMQELKFKTSLTWNITVEYEIETSPWITITPPSGKAGEIVVGINVSENTESYNHPRQAFIYISAGTFEQRIIIIQQIKPLEVDVEKERQALIALYNATDGNNWKNNTNWCSDKPVSEWHGVEAGEGSVTNLFLPFNNLKGSIPSEIGNLPNLAYWQSQDNQLSGLIPTEIGNLKNLIVLMLSNNELSGLIPLELSRLTKLETLDLGRNNFSGSIPSEIGSLLNLSALQLQNNQFTGSIPPEVGNLPNLNLLDLNDNQLTGSVPLGFIENVRWSEMWRRMIDQEGSGFNLTGVPLLGSKYITKDINGNILDYSAIYSQNKYTVLISWGSKCIPSVSLMNQLIPIYKQYCSAGLEIIACGTTGEMTPPDPDIKSFALQNNNSNNDELRNYIQQKGMDVWKNIGLMDFDNSDIVSWPGWIPSAEVIDQNGNIVFAYSGKKEHDDRLGKTTYTDLIPFLKEKFSEIETPILYESTDYSKDGDVLTLHRATVGSGINLVIVGDGFSDKDMGANGKYEQRMKEAMTHFFSEEPTKTYKNRFSVYTVKAVSKNEVYTDNSETIFNCKFDNYSTTIIGNNVKVFNYALKVPNIHSENLTVLTVVNTSAHAGTCYMNSDDNSAIAYCPTTNYDEKAFKEVIVHEAVGHGFGKLSDEYFDNGTTLSSEGRARYLSMEALGWYENVDITSNVTDIQWAHFLSDPLYKNLVGVYNGAMEFAIGTYRATDESIMRFNTGGFNPPSREAIFKRIMAFSGESYNYEKFVTYDAKNRSARRTQATRVNTKYFVPFAPPVIIRSSPNVSR